jgi:hypothetical protein
MSSIRDRSISHTFGLGSFQQADPCPEQEKQDEDMSKDTTKISTFSKKGIPAKPKDTLKSKDEAPLEPIIGTKRHANFNLQKVLTESFNNYSSSPDLSISKKINNLGMLAQKVEDIQKEKETLKNKLLHQFHIVLSNPITIQEFIDTFKKLHE